MPVLLGCGQASDNVPMLDVEMSLVEVYDGQQLFVEVDKWIRHHGFEIESFDTSFWSRDTGRLLSLDGIYARC